MKQISIIADDLTGASDSGVQFARNGLKTQVLFDWSSIPDDHSELDVIVIDTDSRSIPGELAYERAASAAAALKEKGFSFIYKKMDSTLRGNLGQEISGVMDSYSFEAAFIAPAFPRIGRTTVGGIHYLNGTPIHETEMARDPKTPVPDSRVAHILQKQSGLASANVELALLREGPGAVRQFIEEQLRQAVKLFVFDAETDDDLAVIAALMPVFQASVLWGGSAGLAEFLITPDPPKTAGRYEKQFATGAVILVAGSISAITREQVAEVNRQANVAALEMDPLAAIGPVEEQEREIARCTAELQLAIAAGKDISLHAGSSPEQVRAAKEKGAALGLDSSDVSNRIADTLGRITSRVAAGSSVQGLVLTGGDTAKAVCRYLGVSGFELHHEVEPGIPFGTLVGGSRLPAITKAGAFGRKGSLWHAMQHIREGRGE